MSGRAPDAQAVCLEGLVMRFGKGREAVTALDGVNAVIPAGRITGLVGPDAAGKTTLMRIMAGLMPPSEGRANLFGQSPAELMRSQPNSIGYMPQRFGLYEDISVMANMRLHASLRGLEGAERDRVFEKLLGFTSLAPFTERLAGRLSGGMKQKLGIACALLGSPRLLLLDEPGVGVDPQSRRELWRMVQDLSQDGMTVVWSTAYLDEAERCPGVIMLDSGRVLFAGPPEELTARAEGRVFLLRADVGMHKKELALWTMRPGIEDALIQGSRIRLVLAANAPDDLRREVLARGGEAVSPRLEDAYMSAVGGINQSPSPYGKLHVAHNGGNHSGIQGSDDGSIGLASSAAASPDVVLPAAPADSGPTFSISARNLTKRFGAFVAARDISFDVRPGEIFGLLGPNGAGKSTTFRMLCGLSRPTSGSCAVDGVDLLSAGSEARSRLGYMAQKFSLYPDIPVRENITIFAELYGLSRERRNALLPELAEALELQPYLRSRTGSLPLGQKQRLALLCATLHEPPVLFLDEPTSGVDARTRRDFWKHISAMTTAGAAVLVTTHFMEEAEYCDRIALIYRGAMISMGTPDELKASCTEVEDPTLEEAFIASIEKYDREHPQ
ncbi:putative transporter fused subunits of ABC superfamily: ATP-binding components [uncultured Desulfovibrio sp.]|uniref:Putative transporter fused subunits of ABC superfamily: ATP-binding components n=1 Tax=uncultured Desulfovibrio sp. TaxID=167968 RepID=A0A212JA04_9BACT|nr:ATP-binding cassette domain-containing protein [Desulfovibrio desulfuricans]MCB6542360.1 ATP-binding cassette domain-containing protein [Desulfovibrio desulfuricans]MCB6553322.1 ATP-binding cassette domain-containing protein [Desulfovibrio desulfuricans]MCB6565403.1 ATP-binding cassette domain-containing protein [Desulfovibrio desulfuricans]MCB7346465.1 ATP-binding cassette domain-containing protein [Desulfovibrio desulfuricans]MCQ4861337.1 ATP-binding cassette domain-containing protein [De